MLLWLGLGQMDQLVMDGPAENIDERIFLAIRRISVATTSGDDNDCIGETRRQDPDYRVSRWLLLGAETVLDHFGSDVGIFLVAADLFRWR